MDVISLYANDFAEVINKNSIYLPEDLIKKLEEIFEALEENTDCSSELSGGYQSVEYCNKLVVWREVINQVKVRIESKR